MQFHSRPLAIESVVEGAAWNCRIARHHYMRLTTRHHAVDCTPDSRLDARSFIGQNQNVPAMVSLKILGAVRGEAKCEIVVASQLHAGLVKIWKFDLRASRLLGVSRTKAEFQLAGKLVRSSGRYRQPIGPTTRALRAQA